MKTRNFIVIALLALCFTKCEQPHKTYVYKEYPFTMSAKNGESMVNPYAHIECDSFQFVDSKTAYAWIDGTKMKVIAEHHIKVYSNN